jgi:hypothetical protein
MAKHFICQSDILVKVEQNEVVGISAGKFFDTELLDAGNRLAKRGVWAGNHHQIGSAP